MTASPAPLLDTAGALPTLQAPAAWQSIELLSDLHLSEATPRTVQAFLARLAASRADAILLLGDVLEVWVGDDILTRPGFERTLFEQIAECTRGRWVGFMAGNRDFMLGEQALARGGLHLLPDPLCLAAWGRRWLLTHGDALCLADTEYQAFRRQVRSPQWQAGMLALPLEQRIETGRRMREASEARKHGHSPETYADVDLDASVLLMMQAGADVLVHGHTHRPGDETWGAGRRIVLSDWDFDAAPVRGDVLVLSAAGERRVGAAGDTV